MNLLRDLRASLDAWLFKREIDVCRLFAAWFISLTAALLCGMVFELFFDKFILRLDIVLYFFMWGAFCFHKSWPRTLTLIFTWVGMGVMLVMFVVVGYNIFTLMPSGTWMVGTLEMEDPPAWFLYMTAIVLFFALLISIVSLLLLHSLKMRGEIATARLDPAPQPVPLSRLNKRLHRFIFALIMGFYAAGYALPHATDLKEYKVKTSGDFPMVYGGNGTNIFIEVNHSMIVYRTNEIKRTHHRISGRNFFLSTADYPEFQVKPRMKYTLENGVIHEEPWDMKDSGFSNPVETK